MVKMMDKYSVLIYDVTGSRPAFYTSRRFKTLENCYQFLDALKGEDAGSYVFHAEISRIIDDEYRFRQIHNFTSSANPSPKCIICLPVHLL